MTPTKMYAALYPLKSEVRSADEWDQSCPVRAHYELDAVPVDVELVVEDSVGTPGSLA